MAAPKNLKNNKPNPYRPNLWGLFSNIFYHAINKGQLIPLGILVFVLIFVIRLPSSELASFGEKIIGAFESWHILGWVISVIEALVGVVYFRRIRRNGEKEVERVSKEKNELQGRVLNKKLGSSNK